VQGLTGRAAWPGQLDNQPIRQNMTLDKDHEYLGALKAQGKTYMAPVSPWCEFMNPSVWKAQLTL
jgi:hypothetical protein